MMVYIIFWQITHVELIVINKNRIGCNSDPSNTTTYDNGRLKRYAGYPVGCTSQSTDNGFLDQDNYSIIQWLGILGGNASTSIIW